MQPRRPRTSKAVLAINSKWKDAYKDNLSFTYTKYLEFLGKTWKRPRYKRTREIPYIPTEQELDLIISNAGIKTAAFLQFLKETAARTGEALKTKWTDLDTERMLVYIHADKGSRDRLTPISEKTSYHD